MKIPLIRVGITLAFGSVVANVVQFYVAMGEQAADLGAEVPATAKGVSDWFVSDFLFKGTMPSLLFWGGVAVAALGIVRMAVAPVRGRRRVVDPHAGVHAAIAAFRAEGGAEAPGAGTGSVRPEGPTRPPMAREDRAHGGRGGQDPGGERW